MRLTHLLFLAFFTASPTSVLFAQNAREASVKYAKAPQPALLADYNYPAEVVEVALKSRLEKSGFSNSSSSRGFVMYKGVLWNEVSADKMDVYTRVDGKDSKSTVTLLLSKGYDNFISGATDAAMAERGKAFLNSLVTDIAAQSLRLAIAAQEEAIRRAEKAVRDEVKEGEDLASEQEKLQKRIAENKRNQSAREAKMQEEKSKLEMLKKQLNDAKS